MQTQKSIHARGSAKDAFRARRPVTDKLQKEGSAFRWSQLSDSVFLNAAQSKIDETGLADAQSFRTVYRGLTVELARRGYTPEDLFYRAPMRQGAPSGGDSEERKPCAASVDFGQQAAAGKNASGGNDSGKDRSRPRNWKQMDDDQLLEAAQEAAGASGIRDPDAFAEKYRGIACELMLRGYSTYDLEFQAGNNREAGNRELVDTVYREKSFGPLVRADGIKDAHGIAFSWKDLDDDKFVERTQEIIDRRKYPDWGTFIDDCKGLRCEIFRRQLPREEFDFSG